MKAFLRKRWFLLLLLSGVSLAILFPATVKTATDRLEPRYVVALALLLMAWGLEGRRLVQSLVRPLPVLWAAVISYGVLPALAHLAGVLLPDPNYRIGLLISASVPCTLASAVLWTRMAGGNEATALLVTLLTTSISWLATTAWLALGSGVTVSATGMMLDLVLVLVVPVALAQLLRVSRLVANAATRHRVRIGILAQLVLSIIVKATADVSSAIRQQTLAAAVTPLLLTAVLCIGTHLAALAFGLWSSRALGFDRPNQIAVAFSSSQKTLPVALYLFDHYFKADYPLAVVPLVFYHVGQLIVDTFIADALATQQGSGLRFGRET